MPTRSRKVQKPFIPWKMIGKSFSLVFGLPLTILFVISVIFSNSALIITSGVLTLIFVPTFLGMYFFSKYQEHKLNRLKKDGQHFSAEVINISPNHMIRFGGYITVRVFCRYHNQFGQVVNIHSPLICLDIAMFFEPNKEDLKVNVYVNPDNSEDYCVDIYYLRSDEGAAPYKKQY